MDDRTLLEMAAKAAGHSLVWGEVHRVGDTDVDCTDMAYVISNDREESPAYWNPLEDDGDALRLAVKLRIDINTDTVLVAAEGPNSMVAAQEHRAPDPYAATRRAIVRAASQIGQALSREKGQ